MYFDDSTTKLSVPSDSSKKNSGFNTENEYNLYEINSSD